MSSRLRLAAMIVVAGTWFSSPAHADQIALTAGFLDMQLAPQGSTIGQIQLSGDRGFTWFGSMTGGFVEPIGLPLPPGDTVTLLGSADGSGLGGTVTLDGVTYLDVGGANSTTGGLLRFATTVTLPSVLSPPSSVIAPFTVDLEFVFGGQESHFLSGSGMATIFLGQDLGFGVPSWLVTGIRADVSSDPAPVPEPGTLLLVASSLGLAAVRRRRK